MTAVLGQGFYKQSLRAQLRDTVCVSGPAICCHGNHLYTVNTTWCQTTQGPGCLPIVMISSLLLTSPIYPAAGFTSGCVLTLPTRNYEQECSVNRKFPQYPRVCNIRCDNSDIRALLITSHGNEAIAIHKVVLPSWFSNSVETGGKQREKEVED